MSFDISKHNLKALNFRDELIELLKRYQCRLSTTCENDDDMVLEFYDKKLNQYKSYIMTDEGENYNLYAENSSDCIMDTLIKDAFDKDRGEMSGLNSIYVTYGIVTNDGNKAEAKLIEIYNKYDKKDIEYFSLHRHIKILALSNGQKYRWIKPNDGSRGYRCRKVLIDRNITSEELYNTILPICRTKGVDDVEIF